MGRNRGEFEQIREKTYYIKNNINGIYFVSDFVWKQ